MSIPHPLVTVVVPAMNEALNLPWVLSRIDPQHEVVLVDGGSRDETVKVFLELRPDAVVVNQRHPGKGAALAEGMLAARGTYVVMIDADGSMDPAEIPAFVGILESGADVVKGSRYSPGAGSEDITVLRSLGNRALSIAANVLYRQHWSELCYGYAAFRREAFERIELEALAAGDDRGPLPSLWTRMLSGRRAVQYGHGFEIEAILFCRSARTGLRVCEAPSFERDRMHGSSNLATFRDGTRVLGALIWERRPSKWRVRNTYLFPERPGNHRIEA
jgi:glycosyltransferase involved in cell wall biosynthesis